MEERDVKLVQESFAKVAPIADAAAEIFYGKLFEKNPEFRQLFKGDMKIQGKKLMMTLGVVVNGLTNPEKIVPIAEELAKRHVDYGVKAEDYTPVGNALIGTLAEGLGDDFTPEVRAAWGEAYALLSGVMINAAYGSDATA